MHSTNGEYVELQMGIFLASIKNGDIFSASGTDP